MLLPLLALLAVQSGEAKIGDTSERNTLGAAAADVEVEYEGSGDNEDDEDYLDDDYDDEGSGYVYDDEEADLIPDEDKPYKKTEYPPFGSSEDELGKKENAVDDDFHFDESGKTGANNDDDGELYEYYSEDYEPEYDDDDDDEYDEEYEDERSSNNRVLYRAESDIVVTSASDESDSRSLDLSYLYIVLASAFVSFALALATFFLCRSRSLAERQRVRMKQQSAMAMGGGQPFTVITAAQFGQSSIIKSYQGGREPDCGGHGIRMDDQI